MEVVVVGNGMVGHRFCERLRQLDPERRLRITVLGEEPRAAYDRVHLSEFFAGRGAEELALASPAWYAERGIDLRLGHSVAALDRARREVVGSGGWRVPYEMADVLARRLTGAEARF
jgi:nitrite reductase (NADH) large subunit